MSRLSSDHEFADGNARAGQGQEPPDRLVQRRLPGARARVGWGRGGGRRGGRERGDARARTGAGAALRVWRTPLDVTGDDDDDDGDDEMTMMTMLTMTMMMMMMMMMMMLEMMLEMMMVLWIDGDVPGR
jgi:hypothetical protein